MAKRVNKRFLVLLTAVVMGGMLLLAGLYYVKARGTVEDRVKAGDNAWEQASKKAAEGDFQEARRQLERAVDLYGRVVRRYPTFKHSEKESEETEVCIKLGDVMHELTAYDPDQVRRVASMWEYALQVNPGHKTALRRLLQWYTDLAQLGPNLSIYTSIQEKAAALARVEEKDSPEMFRAQAYEQIGIIGAWLAGGGRKVPIPAHVLSSLERFAGLQARNPQEAVVVPDEMAIALGDITRLQKRDLEDAGATPQTIQALAKLREILGNQVGRVSVPPDIARDVAALSALLNRSEDTTIPAHVAKALDRLAALQKQSLDLPDVLGYMLRARLRLYDIAQKAKDPDARKHLEQVKAAIDETIKGLEGLKEKGKSPSPSMLFQCYQARLQMLRIDASTDSLTWRPTTRAEMEAKFRSMFEAAKPLLDDAVKASRPEDRDYLVIRLESARVAGQLGKASDAEAQLISLLSDRSRDALRPQAGGPSSRPADAKGLRDDLEVRLALADILRSQPERRGEAIRLLSVPGDLDPAQKGVAVLKKRGLERNRLLSLVELRLDTYAEADAAEREILVRAMEEECRLAEAMSGPDDPALLRTKGRMLLARAGKDRRLLYEACQVLQKATDTLALHGATDGNLAGRLVTAYMHLGETGRARTLLCSLVDTYPQEISYRLLLTRILLQQRLYDDLDTVPSGRRLSTSQMGARSHLAELERLAKGNPSVLSLRLAMLVGTKQMDEARKLVQSLPEKTDADRLKKAASLMTTGEMAAAEKYLVPMAEAEVNGDGDVLAANELLVTIYRKTSREAEARRLVDRVLAKHAKNVRWKILAAQMRGESAPQEIDEILEQWIETTAVSNPADAAIARYEMLVRQGKSDEAYAALQEADKQANSDDGRILERLLNHAIGAKDWTAAERYAGRLEQKDWDQAGGLYYRTFLMLARQNVDEAVRSALQLVQRQDLARSWLLLGEAQRTAGQYTDALASYAKAMERQSDNAEAMRGSVLCNLALGQKEQAMQWLERGARHPTQGKWFYDIRQQMAEQDDPQSVTAAREKAVKERETDPQTWVALAKNYGAVADRYFQQVAEHMAKGQSKEAEEPTAKAQAFLANAHATLTKAKEKWPDEGDIRELLAHAALRMGKTDEALATIQEWAGREKWKDQPRPLLTLGQYYLLLGDAAKAEAAMLEAIGKPKADLAAKQHVVEFYATTGQGEKAIRMLTEIVEQTKDANLRQELIEMQVRFGKLEDAEKWLQVAMKDNPRDASLIAFLGFVKLRQGDSAKAAEVLEQALRIEPELPAALHYRGLLKTQTGDAAGALMDLRRAVELNPSNADMRLRVADLLRAVGRIEEAERELGFAVQRAPHRKDLRARLVEWYFAEKRWVHVERLLNEAKENAELSRDPHWWKVEARMWWARGNLQKAMDAVVRVTKLAPGDQEAMRMGLEILLQNGQYQNVIDITTPLTQSGKPAPFWAHMLQGIAFRGLNRTEEAGRAFDSALAELEKDKTASVDLLVQNMARAMGLPWSIGRLEARKDLRWGIPLMQFYLATKDWNKAAALADSLVGENYAALSPQQRLDTLGNAAMTYMAMATTNPDAIAKAEKTYTQYLRELEQQRADLRYQLVALNNLACLFAEHPISPDLGKAMMYSRRAKEIMDRSGRQEPGVADTYAWVLILSNQVDQGIDILRDLVSRNDPPPDAFYHLGEAYRMKSRLDEAQATLERAEAAIRNAGQNRGFVDPALLPKVQEALRKVKQAKASSGAQFRNP